MENVFTRAIGPALQVMSLLTLLGALAMTLGVIGVYGVVSHFVNRRQREWGIHLALGLSPPAVAGRIVARGGAMLGRRNRDRPRRFPGTGAVARELPLRDLAHRPRRDRERDRDPGRGGTARDLGSGAPRQPYRSCGRAARAVRLGGTTPRC